MDNNNDSNDRRNSASRDSNANSGVGFMHGLVDMVFDIVSGRADEEEETRNAHANEANQAPSQNDDSDMPPLERADSERRMDIDGGRQDTLPPQTSTDDTTLADDGDRYGDMPELLDVSESESSLHSEDDDDVDMDSLLNPHSDEEDNDMPPLEHIITQPAPSISNNTTTDASAPSPTTFRPTRRPRVEDAEDDDMPPLEPVAQFLDSSATRDNNTPDDRPPLERMSSSSNTPSRRRARVEMDDEAEPRPDSTASTTAGAATNRDQRPIRPLPRSGTPRAGEANTNNTNPRVQTDVQDLFRSILRAFFGDVPAGGATNTPTPPGNSNDNANNNAPQAGDTPTQEQAQPRPQPAPQPQPAAGAAPNGGIFVGVPGGPTIPLGTFNLAPEMMENLLRGMGGGANGEVQAEAGTGTQGQGQTNAPTPVAGAEGATANTEGNDARPTNQPDDVNANGPDLFEQIFRIAMLGGGAGGLLFPFGLGVEPEKDDPERAKRLIAGLDIVSKGLVRRLERVGGAPGAHDDTTVAGDVMCAVCWDSLLDSEGVSWEGDKKDTVGNSETNDLGGELQDPAASTTTTPTTSEAQTSETTDEGRKPSEPAEEEPGVVTLPCAHVFHAGCLKPWFSRPGQTTCPVCRFNIDPDNLTYRYRPARRETTRPAPAATPAAASNAPPASPASATTTAQAAAQSQTPQEAAPSVAPSNETPATGNPEQTAQPRVQRRQFPPFPIFGVGPTPPGGAPVFSLNFDVVFNVPVPAPTNRDQDRRANTAGATPNPETGNEEATQPQRAATENSENAPAAENRNANAEPADGTPQAFFSAFLGFGEPMPPPIPARVPGAGAGPRATAQPRRRQRREWTLPPPPGLTLRQRVEKKEREAGLRCSDISCGFGPTDEDPSPEVSAGYSADDATSLPKALKQVALRAAKGDILAGVQSAVCEHRFHPACLVSAERVNGWVRSEDIEKGPGDEVSVECPVCRADGYISKEEWEEGVKALM